MKVRELIEQLKHFAPELPVIGYCERGEDDFLIERVELDNTDEKGISFYNQGASCMEGELPQPVVVLH